MNNTAKIYTLFFALEGIIPLICRLCNEREQYQEISNSDELFNKFVSRAKQRYSDLKYDLVCEMGLTQTKAEEEFGKLASTIISFLGEFDKNRPYDLYRIYCLWLAYNSALNEYWFISLSQNKPNLDDERKERLRLAYLQYESESSNPDLSGWEKTQSRVEAKFNLCKI